MKTIYEDEGEEETKHEEKHPESIPTILAHAKSKNILSRAQTLQLQLRLLELKSVSDWKKGATETVEEKNLRINGIMFGSYLTKQDSQMKIALNVSHNPYAALESLEETMSSSEELEKKGSVTKLSSKVEHFQKKNSFKKVEPQVEWSLLIFITALCAFGLKVAEFVYRLVKLVPLFCRLVISIFVTSGTAFKSFCHSPSKFLNFKKKNYTWHPSVPFVLSLFAIAPTSALWPILTHIFRLDSPTERIGGCFLVGAPPRMAPRAPEKKQYDFLRFSKKGHFR